MLVLKTCRGAFKKDKNFCERKAIHVFLKRLIYSLCVLWNFVLKILSGNQPWETTSDEINTSKKNTTTTQKPGLPRFWMVKLLTVNETKTYNSMWVLGLILQSTKPDKSSVFWIIQKISPRQFFSVKQKKMLHSFFVLLASNISAIFSV